MLALCCPSAKKFSFPRTKKRSGRDAHCQRTHSASKPQRRFEFRRSQGSILRQGARVTDQQTSISTSGTPVRTIGFLPLLAIFYGYTAGGPFGYEDIFSRSGPGMALAFLTFVPLFWSIPMSFASAELNSILPVQGGFYR